MDYKYSNIFQYFGSENGVASNIEMQKLSLNDLYAFENEVEKKLSNHRTREPSKKRGKKEYQLWVSKTQDILDELKAIRDEIALRK